MKTAIRRVIAMCLVAMMTLAMAATAFATEADVLPAATTQKGSLTVNVNTENTLENQRIYLYKLFDLSVSGDKYAYTVNGKYKDILGKLLSITNAQAPSEDYYNAMSALQGDTVQTFANDFTKELLKAQPAITADKDSGKIGKDVASHTFDDLDYGYYLVYQTGTKKFQSSLMSVDAAKKAITLKGTAPSIEKSADADAETVEIGQIVTYTVTGSIPDTTGYDTYTYIIHDKLTEGLDFVDKNGTKPTGQTYPVSVQIDGENAETMNAKLAADDARKMTLDLSQWVRDKQASVGTEFTVTYYAKVNKDAVVETKNSASLEYGNNPNDTTTTTPVVVTTPTYPLDINKTDAANNAILAGATFRLYKDEKEANAASDNAIKVTKVTGTDGSYTVAEDQNAETNMDMITAATEIAKGYNLRLNGLKEGTYWLVETEAPAGYNKLTAPIKVTITKDGMDALKWTVEKNDEPEDDKIIDVENSSGTVLPETGGMGTVLFTLVSVVMILGVAISFVRSRRVEE